MKTFICYQTHGIKKNDSYEAEPLEVKLRRATEEKTPIECVAPLVYTNKKDGVMPAYDIRTDRFEIAQEAMGKLNTTEVANIAKNEGTATTEMPKPVVTGTDPNGDPS